MINYLTIITMSMFSSCFDIFSDLKKYRKIFFYILIILTTFFVGFRSNLPDYTNYVSFYSNLSTNLVQALQESNFELLFTMVSVIIKMVYDNIYFYFLIIAVSTIYLIFNAYRKLSNHYLISIYLYISSLLIYGPMIQIRNALALGIIMNSLVYISTQEKFKYFSLILVASLFHWSSIVFIPVYFINRLKFNRKISLSVLFLLPLITYVLGNNLFIILEVLGKALPFNNIQQKIMFYINSPAYSSGVPILSPRMISNIFILFITIFFEPSLRRKMKNYDLILGLYFMNTIFRFLVIYMEIFIRFQRLFGFVEPIIGPTP